MFKVNMMKYFIQNKCEFRYFLFALLGKTKILTFQNVYIPHQLLHMLFITAISAISGFIVENNP